MSQRRNDIEGLACLLRLLLGWQEAHGPHVVQAVAHLDDEHARVGGHGHDHLADCFCFRGGTEGDLVELRYTVDQPGHLGTEVTGKVLQRIVSIFHRVVEQSRRDSRGVHTNFSRNGRHRQRVRNIGLAGLTENAFVQALCRGVGIVEQLRVRLRMKFPVDRHQRVQRRVNLYSATRQGAGQAGGHAAHAAWPPCSLVLLFSRHVCLREVA